MRDVFQHEMREVQDRLVEIAELVVVSIQGATQAFNDGDVALAETVIQNDQRIDALTVVLDELSIQILARQNPVARDLRIVVSALRISASLERMGDMAEHIAQLARYRFPDKVVPKSLRGTFKEMGRLDVLIAERLVELVVSRRNARWSFAQGGKEFGQGHYPAMVTMHTLLPASCVAEVATQRPGQVGDGGVLTGLDHHVARFEAGVGRGEDAHSPHAGCSSGVGRGGLRRVFGGSATFWRGRSSEDSWAKGWAARSARRPPGGRQLEAATWSSAWRWSVVAFSRRALVICWSVGT